MPTDLRIAVCQDFAALQGQRARWNELARGNPFLEWDWLRLWWQNYGLNDGRARPGHELQVVTVWRGETLLGAAPWFARQTLSEGRALRFLGSGEVCGDYLSLLCTPETQADVVTGVAQWLLRESLPGELWDLLELNDVLGDDQPLTRLVYELQAHGAWAEALPQQSTWSIDLSGGWAAYLAQLSKSHRKEFRRCERQLDSGQYQYHKVTSDQDFDEGWGILVDLHTRRRQSLGERGCFASRRFAAFHEQIARHWLNEGRLELSWITAADQADRPLAVEYHIRDGLGNFAYQSGIDPTALAHEPGRIATVAIVRDILARGGTSLDLLRGDEAYKPHYRARPRKLVTWRIVPDRAIAKWRSRVTTAGVTLKRWLKTGLETLSLRDAGTSD
jgi:CelD/BcsL family acetyltransferase involved in cellulose biosynthesis